MSDVIIAKNLTKISDFNSSQILLRQVDLVIEQRKKVLITGPSGSGKTTLLHTLSGLDSFNKGSLALLGHDMGSLSHAKMRELRRRDIGIVFQFHHLIQGLSVRDNIMMPLMIQGVPHSDINTICEILNLSDMLLSQPVNLLSGGEKQRVALARSLIHRPKILFLDEPTGCLDQKNARDLWDMLSSLHSVWDMTVIVVSHDMGFANFSDQHLTMLDGRIYC